MSEKRRHPRKPKHDASYKRIFAHSRTTADLLRGFVGDLAPHLDFTTLERLPASFVTEHFGQRHADLLWKMQTVERRWLYLLVLLEFQSTVDSRMALRMLDYTVRVLQGLVRDELDPDGRFPPVLPLVIYNGHSRWNAPTEVRDYFAPVPRELVGYLPGHRYLLLDLKALDPLLLPVENVVSLVTMLEQAGSQAQLEELGASLATGCDGSARRSCSRASRPGSGRCWRNEPVRRADRISTSQPRRMAECLLHWPSGLESGATS